jgi:hypothetical protein
MAKRGNNEIIVSFFWGNGRTHPMDGEHMKREKLNIYLTGKQKKQLKTEAEETGISMSAIIKNLINQHFNRSQCKHDN